MKESSIVKFASIISQATKKVIQAGTGMEISNADTFLKVPNIKISGDIGTFVSYKGDYEGIIIINFSGGAAIEIVTAYLTTMGMPKEDIPSNHTSDDVRDNIGELVNQIMGSFRNMVQQEHDLVAYSNIPAVIPITIPIVLLLETSYSNIQECMRIPFYTPSSHRFYIELSIEPLSMVKIPKKRKKST